MEPISSLITRDLRHVWHPCSQMKQFETTPPLVVTHAEGNLIYTDQGPLIDAISSWWCKSLGHGHPTVLRAIQKQLGLFEHVIGANTTHANLVKFAELLAELTGLQHLFFASDGACAVEIAMKMALQAQQIKGYSQRKQFIALSQGYHGETLGALCVSDLGEYKAAYAHQGIECHFIPNLPYVSGADDPLWHNAEAYWQSILPMLNEWADQCCAIILEPLIQGAAGMRLYSADFLKRLGKWAQDNQILLIADEIMTGMGRCGDWLASHQAGIKPDLICLSKGLTAGTLPLSVVMVDHPIYELFYADQDPGRNFLHSHTFSGHPLAVSAALATLQVLLEENLCQRAQQLGSRMLEHMRAIARETGVLHHVRQWGAIVAAELSDHPATPAGQAIYREAISQGALLRPIGNTLYWLPPLNMDDQTLANLAEVTLNSINTVYHHYQP